MGGFYRRHLPLLSGFICRASFLGYSLEDQKWVSRSAANEISEEIRWNICYENLFTEREFREKKFPRNGVDFVESQLRLCHQGRVCVRRCEMLQISVYVEDHRL